ncbi:MAG: hypothetical protein EAZ55_04870 [Cytophagales bacterium]|nr:MAG: hypothetical protein EAZ55_04870 [Cytophagales bacterium]
MKTKIATYALIPIILFLIYSLVMSVKGPIDEQNRIKKTEDAIIAKLKVIRELQNSYYAANNKYAAKWSELRNFVNQGYFWIIDKRERDLGNGKISLRIDTLGKVPVKDSLKNLIAGWDINRIEYIPLNEGNKQFSLYVGKKEISGVKVEVIEVKDTDPINPLRKAKNKEKALRIGSKDEATLVGNWE